jgi:PBP1b-binding outer membrane lipoprotein LpoB
MKGKVIILTFALIIALAGCTTKPAPSATPTPTPTLTPTQAVTPTPTQTTPPETTPNVVTTASIVDTAAAFEKAISNTGTWIIAIVKDLSIDKDLVLDGEFKNGKKDTAGKDIIQRKLAF